jgi:hypothetical protein
LLLTPGTNSTWFRMLRCTVDVRMRSQAVLAARTVQVFRATAG